MSHGSACVLGFQSHHAPDLDFTNAVSASKFRPNMPQLRNVHLRLTCAKNPTLPHHATTTSFQGILHVREGAVAQSQSLPRLALDALKTSSFLEEIRKGFGIRVEKIGYFTKVRP